VPRTPRQRREKRYVMHRVSEWARRLREEAGAATAEYAIVIMATVAPKTIL